MIRTFQWQRSNTEWRKHPQGKKQVELGQHTFIYDPSRFLLTSVALPVVSRVAEATKETPCLVLLLKLDMGVIRELLSLEEIGTDSIFQMD